MIEFSSHARDMLKERRLEEVWVWRVIEAPMRKWSGDDNNIHYAAPIEERGGRFLHVVVNESVSPKVIVTQFLDRRIRREHNETED